MIANLRDAGKTSHFIDVVFKVIEFQWRNVAAKFLRGHFRKHSECFRRLLLHMQCFCLVFGQDKRNVRALGRTRKKDTQNRSDAC